MIAKYITANDFFYIIPVSLALGAGLASVEPGSWLIGFLSFSLLFLFSFSFLYLSHRWANAGRTLGWIIAITFFLRLAIGMLLHFSLPLYGHDDEDDRAGYVFTDAHRRDNQAWTLATSDLPVTSAFSERYGSDQYGGLLAFNTFVYRYFSPDAQRPLLLVLLAAFFAALGIPLFWKAVNQVFGEKVAWASTWIFALFPDSVLLGASAMREPYLLTFTAFALWGFIKRFHRDRGSAKDERSRTGWIWIALGLGGMVLVSPAIALVTIFIFAGWMFFTDERRQLSWRGIAAIALIFILGLFFLSASLNRSGEFDSRSPLHVINGWFQAAVKWDAYQLERESGWVQKIFDEGPRWIRLPFVAIYGIFQPVLPATIVRPTLWIWKLIILPRALAWYALLPILTLSFAVAAGQSSELERSTDGSKKIRNLLLWLALIVWIWILLAALRGGADLWDNPRYRTILFVWQAILAGSVWVWWRETQNAWFTRILLMEAVFLVFFTQWYANRYIHLGGQLPFAVMVAVILGLWALIVGIGLWRDRQRVLRSDSVDKQGSPTDKRSTSQSDGVDKQSSPADKSRA